MVADTQWHFLLLARIKVLLASLESKFGLKPTDNIGRKLSKKALPSAPLASAEDLAYSDVTTLRVDTVHKAKGESLDSVLYVTLKEHAQALLDGVSTEVGRIGYVAATRARDLLWVAVPHSALKDLGPMLLAKGFKEGASQWRRSLRLMPRSGRMQGSRPASPQRPSSRAQLKRHDLASALDVSFWATAKPSIEDSWHIH